MVPTNTGKSSFGTNPGRIAMIDTDRVQDRFRALGDLSLGGVALGGLVGGVVTGSGGFPRDCQAQRVAEGLNESPAIVLADHSVVAHVAAVEFPFHPHFHVLPGIGHAVALGELALARQRDLQWFRHATIKRELGDGVGGWGWWGWWGCFGGFGFMLVIARILVRFIFISPINQAKNS